MIGRISVHRRASSHPACSTLPPPFTFSHPVLPGQNCHPPLPLWLAVKVATGWTRQPRRSTRTVLASAHAPPLVQAA
eukprot:44174-Chlamydomonas_euryale.AAC.1